MNNVTYFAGPVNLGPEFLIVVGISYLLLLVPWIIILATAHFSIRYWLEYSELSPRKQKLYKEENLTFIRLMVFLSIVSILSIVSLYVQIVTIIIYLPVVVVAWYITGFLPFNQPKAKKVIIPIIVKRLLLSLGMVASFTAWLIVLRG